MNIQDGDAVGGGSEEKRRERLHRREVIAAWKAEARALRAADPGKRMLLWEAKRESLRRIEEAARTEADFINVTLLWDDREIVEGWRVGKHEGRYGYKLPYAELPDRHTIIPPPIGHIWWRELLQGSFLDVIFDCPYEIQELTASHPVFDITSELDERHKELLYYRAIRQWAPQLIAAFRGQTDRNVRDVYTRLMESIRRELFIRLYPRYQAGAPLTSNQREFCRTYGDQLDEIQRDRIAKKIADGSKDNRRSGG